MKPFTSLLYLTASLGLCAANPEWIAVLQRNLSSASALQHHEEFMLQSVGATHQQTFELGSFRGYAFSGPDDAAERVAQHPDVAYIQPNGIVTTYGVMHKEQADGVIKQETSSWALAAISHRSHDGAPAPSHEYLYDERAGNGTLAYVVDTGIDIHHDEFEGRAEWGVAISGGKLTDNHMDENGHGTHVAGIIGSRSYGVAKKTQLVAVKVINADGGGTTADIVQGILWAHADAQRRGALGRAVVNISLGTRRAADGPRDAQMDAVAEVVRRGLFVASAAGNMRQAAPTSSPGAEPAACNAGAHDARGRRADFSNFGPGIDVWAPGLAVPSVAARARVATMSGTSMAAPHVAGVAALLLARRDAAAPAAAAARLCDDIRWLGAVRGGCDPEGGHAMLYNGGEGLVPKRRRG